MRVIVPWRTTILSVPGSRFTATARKTEAAMTKDQSTARSRDLGRQLAMIRQSAGFSMVALAERIGTWPPTLSRIESGMRGLSDVKFIQYLTLCGLKSEDIVPLLDLARTPDNGYHFANFTGRVSDELIALVVHETTASTVQQYENNLIPGLLQTPDYARALFAAGGRVTPPLLGRAVQLRMDRQSVLQAKNPARCTFFLCEDVLRSTVGDASIMHDQLMRLYFATEWESCSIRVVPLTRRGETTAPGSFRLMTFADHDPVAMEELLTALVFLERPDDIAVYREALECIDRVALSAGQSKELIAHLADEYAWTGAGRHAAGDVAQE
jgi:hypothetical protein